jgi:hypothetical protein
LNFLAGVPPVRVHAAWLGGRNRDEGIVTLEFPDGSVGTIVYAGSGSLDAGKERVEVFAGGATFVLDDYRSLDVFGLQATGTKTRAVEKGQRGQIENLFRALRGEADLAVTAEDGYRATWCAEQAVLAGTR